jgi:ferredoxin
LIQSRIQKKRKNHKCPAVNVCHVGALSQKDFEAPKIDYDKCIKCGKCSNFCPKKALVLDKKMQCIKYEQNNNLFSCLQFFI